MGQEVGGTAEPKAASPPARREALIVAAGVSLTILCWSSNFPFLRFILQVYDPNTTSVLRLITGAVALAGYAAATRLPLPPLRDWPLFFVFGLTGVALATLLLNYGMRTLSAGAGSFLIGTVPIFSALFARLFLRERLNRIAWWGIAISFGGVGLIALGEGEGLRLNVGAVFVVASALNQAFYYVFQKLLHRRYTSMQITCYSIICGALCVLPLLGDLPALMARAPLGHTLAVMYLGIFPTALAFTAWNFALSRARAAKVTSTMYAMPALAITMAYFWLGEIPATLSLLGGLTALGGVAMVHVWGR